MVIHYRGQILKTTSSFIRNVLIPFVFTHFFLFITAKYAAGSTFAVPDSGNNIVGSVHFVEIQPGQSIYSLARENDVGVLELLAANPHIKANHLKAGTRILIPTAHVLPNAPQNGIIINLPEMRLYYFSPILKVVMTFPIGIGKEGWETPVQEAYVQSKEQSPFWYPPESIRNYTLQTKGKSLGKVVPPGPDNPLGDYAIHLSLSGYLIHGTNQPKSIGQRSSSGCIRMYPEDIEQLFYQVPIGTPVYIIHQPYKLGSYNHEYYLEIHQPLSGYDVGLSTQAMIQLATQNSTTSLDWERIEETIKDNMGFPILVGRGA